jgi:hypothetical protein
VIASHDEQIERLTARVEELENGSSSSSKSKASKKR